jgi:hypothetical protein
LRRFVIIIYEITAYGIICEPFFYFKYIIKIQKREEYFIMPRANKTAADVREDIAKTENKLRQTENRIKELIQQNSKEARKARTNRLIQRGLIIESMIKESETLTNEQIKTIVQTAFRSAHAAIREMAAAFRVENAAITEKQTDENQSELPN